MKQRYKNYKQYLASDVWKAKKAAVFERARKNTGSTNRFGICEACLYEPYRPGVLQVHHLEYPEVWGTESINSLVCVCARCHKKLHRKEGAAS